MERRLACRPMGNAWGRAPVVTAHLSLPCPGMWGLVNNAGISTFGEVEFTSMETYKEVAEVNLWGTVRTTKSFLPLIRRAKGEWERELPPAPESAPHVHVCSEWTYLSQQLQRPQHSKGGPRACAGPG